VAQPADSMERVIGTGNHTGNPGTIPGFCGMLKFLVLVVR
jgi:hypothetical protein